MNVVDPVLGTPRLRPRWVGNYELLREIGHGGMGVVFEARQRGLNRIVAVKMILAGQFSGAEALARFRGEAELAAQLRHPNIVAIHEVGEHEGEPFFSMEFVEGRNLTDLIREQSLPARVAASYLQTIAEAIHYAHQQGVLHRDIKPSNILIDAAGQPRITDFGLAKRLSEDSELTVTGQVLGSPGYAAPEQVMGWRQRIGPASDIYSLGAVLYHLLTRRPPFIADTVAATVRQVLDDEPVPVRRLNPTVPADLETICLKCLEKDPLRRYATAEALAADLTRFLRSEPILGRPPGVLGRLARWRRRKPALAAALIALAGVVVVSTSAVLSQWQRAEASAAAERRQGELAQKRLFVADTQLAYQAWELENLTVARSLLAAHAHRTSDHDFAWRYLWNRCRGDFLFVLRGHTKLVAQIAFSPDNRRLVSCDRGQVLKLWDLEQRRQVWSAAGVVALGGFMAGGTSLLASTNVNSVSWLDLATGRVTRSLPTEGLLLGVVKAGAAFATTGTNFLLKLWDSASGQPLAVIPGAQSYLGFSDAVSRRVRVTPDGSVLGSFHPGRTNNLAIWNVERGVRQTVTTVPRPFVLALSSDGTKWLVGDLNGHIYQGISVTNLFATLTTQARCVTTLAFSPDASEFISGHDTQILCRWNTQSGELTERCYGQATGTVAIAFSPDDKLVVTGGQDGALQVWTRHLTPAVATIEGLRPGWMDLSAAMVLSPDGLLLAVAHGDQTIKLLSVDGLREQASLPESGFPLSFSDRGRRLLTVSGDRLRWWDVARTSIVHEVTCPASVQSARIVLASPDEQSVLFVGPFGNASEDELVLCTAADGRPRVHARPSHIRLTRVGFSRDSQELVGIDHNNNVFWWSTIDGRLLRSLAAHPPPPAALVTVMRTAQFMEQDVEPVSPQPRFPAALAQSPDGSLLLTAGTDGSVKLWGANTLKLHLSLLSPRGAVTDAAFSPDGRSFATADLSETIRLWNVELGRETGSLNANAAPASDRNSGITRLLFAANGDVLLALNRRGQLKAWSVGRSHVP